MSVLPARFKIVNLSRHLCCPSFKMAGGTCVRVLELVCCVKIIKFCSVPLREVLSDVC